MDVAHHPQHDLLAHLLHRGRDVELPLRHPRLRLAVRASHVHMNPRMWIHPLQFADNAFETHRLIGIEFRAECVMSPDGRDGQNQTGADHYEI